MSKKLKTPSTTLGDDDMSNFTINPPTFLFNPQDLVVIVSSVLRTTDHALAVPAGSTGTVQGYTHAGGQNMYRVTLSTPANLNGKQVIANELQLVKTSP